jgi:nucleoside-diphosphate-sugar epimerase
VKRALLTGASGFIGAHAPAALLARGFEVHAVGRGEPLLGVHWHRADLHDSVDLLARVQPTHVLHLAWFVDHGLFWNSLENLRWLATSVRMLGELRGARAVFAGTCAEYDWSESGRRHESSSRLAPATLYGVSKDALRRTGEAVTRDFAWGRLFFPYGPGEPAQRLVPTVARGVLAGRPVPCSSGTQVRDYIHAADAAGAFVALLDSDVTGAVNIGSGEAVSVGELAMAVARAAGDTSLVRLGELPDRAAEPEEIVADVTRLRDEVGFAPTLTLTEGVADTVAWWREQ